MTVLLTVELLEPIISIKFDVLTAAEEKGQLKKSKTTVGRWK